VIHFVAKVPPTLLTGEAIAFYKDNPVPFVDDNFLSCAREVRGDKSIRLSRDQK
jgi:hypothetical protein